MKEMSIDTIELGNLLFSNSRGNYSIERSEWQDIFCDFLDKCGFDSYGYKNDLEERCFENDTFIVRPYYWGDDEDIANLPNFEYKPIGFTISWYKYPMRNAYASHNITTQEFEQILCRCSDSMGVR